MARLKVFCTSSGFHDALVAAPSKAAALEAWGAKTDLFSLGAARLITDPDLVKKALARPGDVIRVKRGGGGEEVSPSRKSRPSRRKPPSRARLDAASKRLAELEASQENEVEALEGQLRALEKKRGELLARHAKARAAAELRLEKARGAYEKALAGRDR